MKEFVDVMEVNVGKFIKVDGIRWVLYFLWVIEVLVGKNYKVIVVYFVYIVEVNDLFVEM